KTYAGLRDAYVYADNETAKTMFLALCDWGINICSKLTDAQMQAMLGSEHGGINEMYADAYQMTGTAKYLTAARRFSHNDILNPAAAGNDNLDNKHANTQVPKVVGFQRIAEVGNDNTHYKAAEFFWTTVTTKRSLSLGGNSHNEFFPAASACMNYISGREGVETCNTNNMMKLTEGLFRMKPEAKYADFYERALYNHILSAIHPTHGGYVYFTPSHPRHYRVYSAPDVAMWCCVGTGMENPTKYGQFIYTNSNDSLYVNLFVPSVLTWKAKNCTLTQTTKFPDEEQTVLKVGLANPRALTILIRHPYWVPGNQFKIIIDGDTVSTVSKPSTYVAIARTWYGGEEIKVLLPMSFRYEPLINVPSYVAIMRGPILLGAKTGADNLNGLIADASRMGHVPSGTLPDYNSAPKLSFNIHTLGSKMKPVAGKTFAYKAPEIFVNKADTNLVFEPFFRIHDARYMTYWNATIATDVNEQLNHVSISNGNAVMSLVKGGVNVAFASEDPSRHITLYRLNGIQLLDIPASSRSVSLKYSTSGLRSGVYTMKIQSDKMQMSKMFTVAGN
ncbi:MAG: hypothetical protein GX639_01860, partial [Fibrobacter sp.]|nr:hypothetical protein [Fibrobacter sp.]